jgi:hypothetical protein
MQAFELPLTRSDDALIYDLATACFVTPQGGHPPCWRARQRARATVLRPLATPPSSRATGCSTTKSTPFPSRGTPGREPRRSAQQHMATHGPCSSSMTSRCPRSTHAAENLGELVMRRYDRASTILTSNRPVADWVKLLGGTAAVTALLDHLVHHAHILKCNPGSSRTTMAGSGLSSAARVALSERHERMWGEGGPVHESSVDSHIPTSVRPALSEGTMNQC